MAKKAQKAKKEAGGGAKDSLPSKPVVESLESTVDHLRWLSWFGGNFDPDMIITTNHIRNEEEPPMPGTCGISRMELSVGDLVEFVDAAACDVAHAVSLLVGSPPASLGSRDRAGQTAGRRPRRRRARR